MRKRGKKREAEVERKHREGGESRENRKIEKNKTELL